MGEIPGESINRISDLMPLVVGGSVRVHSSTPRTKAPTPPTPRRVNAKTLRLVLRNRGK